MLEQMQQEMVALRSKIDGSGPSNASKGQNVGSSSLAIQIGTRPATPNAAITIGTICWDKPKLHHRKEIA